MGWVVSVTPLQRFTPGERTPGTHCTGGWVGPRAGLDTEVRGKILSPLPGIEPLSSGRPARSQTLYWLSYPGFPIFRIYYAQYIHDLCQSTLAQKSMPCLSLTYVLTFSLLQMNVLLCRVVLTCRTSSMWNSDKWYLYVVKNAIQRASVWYNGDLCWSCVTVQTKLHVSQNMTWFLTSYWPATYAFYLGV
jgi:hypothetical protein